MTLSRRKSRALLHRASAALLLTLLVVAFITLFVGARGIKSQLDVLAIADSDNLGWNISQMDVDFRGLSVALLEPLTEASDNGTDISAAELSDIKRAFDIFYSRVNVVAATFHRVGVPVAVDARLREIEDARDVMADIIDAIDTPSSADVLAVLAIIKTLGPDVRALTTEGIQILANLQSGARRAQYDTFLRFHAKTFIILVFVLLSCLLAIRLWRDLEERSRRVEMAATNVNNAIEAALSAVVFLDVGGRIVQCNKAAETHFGSSRHDLLGVDFVNSYIDPGSLQEFHDYQNSPGIHSIRLVARRGDFQTFPIEMSGTWEKDVEGKDIYIVFLTDISRQLEAEDKLKASRDEAKLASQAKTRFLATMSHEMRTPLHGLIASLDMIQTKSLSQADQQLFRTARECSTRALDQVNGVLDHTRITQAREKERAFTPGRVIRDIRDALTPLAAANGNLLDFEMTGDGVDARYIGLPDAFSRVMYNLIGNAIKFTHDGTILIEMIATQGQTPRSRRLNVLVRDTGPGIAEADQERIFDRFETATAHDDDAKGTGLGLAIVKHSLEQMNSTIQLRSAPGKGSRFSFALDLEMAAREEDTRASLPHTGVDEAVATAPQGDVLIVDDNSVNRIVLQEMVSRLGFTPHCVPSGPEAVQAAETTAFTLVLMDVSMPGMDGHEATRNIREGGGRSAGTVILGVTALIPEDQEERTQSGMDAVLAKPLTADRLAEAIERHVTGAGTPQDGDILQLMDPDTAKELTAQSLDDVRAALKVIDDPASSWDARRDAIHYAVGSTAVVGLRALSQSLATAETAAKARNVHQLTTCAAQIREALAD